MIKDNFFGALTNEAIEIEGAGNVQFMDNHFDTTTQLAIKIQNAKEIHFKMNYFRLGVPSKFEWD